MLWGLLWRIVMNRKMILPSLSLIALIAVIFVLVFLVYGTEGSPEGPGSVPAGDKVKNAEPVWEIAGYTDTVEARLGGSDPVPGYIIEKYGTVYIPADVMVYDLVEIRDPGLERDNSTSLVTRIYDDLYDLNYSFLGTLVQENGVEIDEYYSIISYINDSEHSSALLFAFGYPGSDKEFYRQEIVFQSQYGEEFGIHVMPVQDTASAMNSTKPLYIVYSSKDVDHDYTTPLPDL